MASKGSKISALIDECEAFEVTDDQRHAAARVLCGTVVRNAPDDAEHHSIATDLLGMLGLLPHQKDENYATALVRPQGV